MLNYSSRRLDHVGIGLSLLYALHCSLLPLVLTTLPLLGLGFLANDYWEAGMITASFIIGCFSLIDGYRRIGVMAPLILLTIGFILIFAGQLFVSESYEWKMMVAGGLLVATAHFYNWKLMHKRSVKPSCCVDNECPGA